MATNSAATAKISGFLEKNSDFDESAFVSFCQETFYGTERAKNGRSPIDLYQSLFDFGRDGKKTEEKRNRTKTWLADLVSNRKSALIIVDFQNDFIDGSLSIRGGPAQHDPTSIIDPINRLIETVPFDVIVYTYDWHPPNHISFLENIASRRVLNNPNDGGWKLGDTVHFSVNGNMVAQRVWPKHCVQNTTGAELHPRLRISDDKDRTLKIYKGSNPEVDSYSAFFDNERKSATGLHEELARRGISDLYVGGLAYDICVAWTALDALTLGYKTAVIDDCSCGLNLMDIDKVKADVSENGVIIKSEDVAAMTSGKHIPWNWAYGAAVRLFQK